jgi:hypothetical protein
VSSCVAGDLTREALADHLSVQPEVAQYEQHYNDYADNGKDVHFPVPFGVPGQLPAIVFLHDGHALECSKWDGTVLV